MNKIFTIIFISFLLLSCKRRGDILSLTWMNKEFTDTIKYYNHGDTVGLLVKTKNFKKGKTIEVDLKDDERINENGDTATVKISGVVERKGLVKIIVDTERVFSEFESK